MKHHEYETGVVEYETGGGRDGWKAEIGKKVSEGKGGDCCRESYSYSTLRS